MAHFARVVDGVVTEVIVAEQAVLDTGLFGSGWVQTSYRTRAGEHPEGQPLRKNYAGIGFTYDEQRDAFIPPKDFPSWTLNEDTCTWNAPIAKPDDGKLYAWNEETTSWDEVEPLPEPVITTEAIEALSTEQIVSLQTDQIQSLTTDQISALTSSDANGGV